MPKRRESVQSNFGAARRGLSGIIQPRDNRTIRRRSSGPWARGEVIYASEGRLSQSKSGTGIPLPLEEGTEIEVEIHPAAATPDEEDEAWREFGMSRLEEEWDNPQDAVYDDWRKLYGV